MYYSLIAKHVLQGFKASTGILYWIERLQNICGKKSNML